MVLLTVIYFGEVIKVNQDCGEERSMRQQVVLLGMLNDEFVADFFGIVVPARLLWPQSLQCVRA